MEPDLSLSWVEIKSTGFINTIGPVRTAYTPEPEHRWFATIDVEKSHLNQGGVCHGGVLMSLVDIAMGSGAWHSGGMHGCATIQMESKFLAAAKEGQTLLAMATQSRRTRDLSFMACDVWGGGRLVFKANGVWKYLATFEPQTKPLT